MYGSIKSLVAALAITAGSLGMSAEVKADGYGYGYGGYRGHHHHRHHHGYYRGCGPRYVGVPAVAVVPPVVYPAPAPAGISFSISNGFFGFSANSYQPAPLPYYGSPYFVRP